MANSTTAFGALDFQHAYGSQRTEELDQRWIASSDPTPIFYGDLVQTYNTMTASTTLQTGGFGPYITQGCSIVSSALTGAGWAGVFRGCEYYVTQTQRVQFSRYWPGQGTAGTSSQTGDIKAYIVSDPNQRFIIKVSSQNILGSSNIGTGFGVAVNGANTTPSSAGGNTTNGNSGMQLASSQSFALTSTTPAPFILMDFISNWAPGQLPGLVPGSGTTQFVDGADNTTVGQIVIVKPWYWATAL